jgi:diketogulonate reductase-like aldo/keto reductase
MDELAALEATAGSRAAANQVLYNLTRRGIEHDLLPLCQSRGMAVMAYSPLEQGRIATRKSLQSIAHRIGATAAQVALAWVLRTPGVMAIPKSARVERVRENRAALDIVLTPEDLAELDVEFPPPSRKIPLEMI